MQTYVVAHNTGNSLIKRIDIKQKLSVEQLSCAERNRPFFCEGVTVDNFICSLNLFSDAMWFGKGVERHIKDECMGVFKVFIIGRHNMVADSTIFLSFANVCSLLNLFRASPSGYAIQLFADVTSQASTAALKKLVTCLVTNSLPCPTLSSRSSRNFTSLYADNRTAAASDACGASA